MKVKFLTFPDRMNPGYVLLVTKIDQTMKRKPKETVTLCLISQEFNENIFPEI